MEEIKKSTAPKKPTVKQLYLQAAGTEVGMDYFLYTCLEEEKTIAGLTGKHLKLNSKKRHPAIIARTPDELGSELDQALVQLVQWYATQFPVLTGSATLDYSVHSEQIGPFVELLLDIRDLHRLKDQALASRLTAEQSLEADAGWQRVLEVLHSNFPHYYKFMLAYISWVTRAPDTAPLDLTSVPPVGRYLQLLNEARRRAERKATQGSYGERSYGDRRSHHRDGSAQRGGRDAGPRSGDGHGQHRRPQRQDDRSNDFLQDVDQAIAKMKKNVLLKDLVLAPQNSFARREQHKRVKELGFVSHSSGEGADRAVKISRSKKNKPAKHQDQD